MSWNYGGNPASSELDAVRLLIGDTDTTDQQLTDEEINYVRGITSSVRAAAIGCIRLLIARYARKVDKAIGDLKISYSQRLKQYQELITQVQLDIALNSSSAAPYAGGISISDKETVEEDTDRVEPSIKLGIHDNGDQGTEGDGDVSI